MVFTKATATVKSLCHPKGSKFKKINLGMIWQRAFVWDSERISLFVHTVMSNGYVYPILVADEEGSDDIFILDGLQRISSLRKMISNDMKLDANTPPVNGVEVARKSFKQLPAELQDAILDFSFDLVYVKGATEEEKSAVNALKERAETFFPVPDGAKVERNRYGELRAAPKLVRHIFENVAPRFKDRAGGYTRIVKLGRHRIGDGSELCVIQFVGAEEGPEIGGKPSGRRRQADKRTAYAAKVRKSASAA